jgi:hypothetical protein
MFNMYLNFVLMYFIFYICGYPLKVFLLGDDLKKFDMYVTPWLGVGLVICVLFPMSWLGFSVESIAGYFVMAVLAAGAAVWFKYREPVHCGRNDAIFLISLGFIAGAVYGFKLAANPDLYAVTLSGDYASYLNDARAALVSSAKYIAALPEGVPNIGIINRSLNFEMRGCVFAQAFVSVLLRMDLARVSYLLSAFVMFLNVAAFRLFFRNFKYISVAVPITAILLVNLFYGKLIYMAFIGQLFSVGFVILAFFLECYLVERGKFEPAACLLLVFVLTACNLSYLNALAFPLIPVLALWVVLPLNKKYDRASCLKNAAFAGTTFAAVNFMLIVNFVKTSMIRTEIQDGFAMYMPTFMDIAGLQGVSLSPDIFFALLLISNAVLIFTLIYQLKREGFMSFISVSCILFILTHIAICVKYFSLGETSSYNAFKSALSLSFAVYILIIRFLEERFNGIREAAGGAVRLTFKRVAACTVSLILFVSCIPLNIKATLNYLDIFDRVSSDDALTKSFEAVKKFASNAAFRDSDFIVNIDIPLSKYGAAYFAPFGRTYICAYGGLTLDGINTMKDSFKPGDIYVASVLFEKNFNTVKGSLLLENDALKIYQLNDESVIQYDYKGFSYRPEKIIINDAQEYIVRQVFDDTVRIVYLARKDITADISMTFQNFGNEPLSANVYLRDALIAKSSQDEGGLIKIGLTGVTLKSGLNGLTLKFEGGATNDLLLREIKMGRIAPE